MAKRKAKPDLKEPLVILPDDYGQRSHTRPCLKEMKRSGATEEAIQVMKNELDRQAEQINQGTAKARQAKGKRCTE